MRTTFTRKHVRMAAACALALGVMSGTVSAQLAPAKERALVTDNASQVWMNGYGECWHSGFGPAPSPNPVCDSQPIVAPKRGARAGPVAAAAAAQAASEKVTVDANVLFDFNKSTLRPAWRDTLDSFVARIKGIASGTITAIGYADRFGSERYNQTLSEKRVATVKAYLVSKGIEATRVQTSGKGKTQPTTKAGECAGARNARTIACLQPDRHVFVGMTGLRIKQ